MLHRLGVEVKSGSPRSCACPLCQAGSLRLYDDNIASFWLFCPSCRFSGDGIHLYAAFHKLDVGTAVRRMVREGAFPPETDVSEYQIDRYVARISDPWQTFQNFVARASTAYEGVGVSRSHGALLRRYGLWRGYGTEERKQPLSKFIGGSTKTAVKDLPASTGSTLHHTTYRGGVGSVLIVPSYDLPGRPRAVYVLAESGQAIKELNIRPGGSPGYSDHGLALLDSVGDSEDVYAVRDLLLALHLQAATFATRPDPLPIVVWTERTDFAWNTLRGKNIHFWQPYADSHVFKAALRFPSATVSFSPDFPLRPSARQIEEYVSSVSPAGFIDQVRQNSNSPYVALLREIEKDRGVGVCLLEDIRLTERQEAMLIDGCKPKDREKIREVLDVGRTGQPFVFEGRVIIETDEGLFEQRGGSGLGEQIADIQIVPELNFRYSETDRTDLSGYVLFKGERIAFWEDRAHIDRNPARWVEKLLMDQGYAQPVIHSRYRKKLLQLAIARHRPPTTRALERVGWDESGQLLLPRLRIADGKVEAQVPARVPVPDEQPGHTLEPIAKLPAALFRKAVKKDGSVRFFWAFSVALLRNLLAPQLGWKTVPVGVAGENQKDGPLGQLCRAYGLEIAEFYRNTLPPPVHHMPRILRTTPRRQILIHNLIEDRRDDPIFFNLRESAIPPVALHRAAILIGPPSGPFDIQEVADLPDLLPHFIAWMQADAFAMPAAPEPILQLTQNLGNWLRIHATLDFVDGLIEEVEGLIYHTPSSLTERTVGSAFLKVCENLGGQRALDIEHREDGSIVIDLAEVARLCKILQFPVPPFDEIAESLTRMNRLRSLSNKRMVVAPE